MLRDGHRRPYRDRWRPGLLRGLSDPSLQRRDRVGKHLLIQLVADLLDVTRLLIPEEVTGATDVEVVARQLEPGAEGVERLQHFEPLLGLRRDLPVSRDSEQRVGARFRAPDPAAQLIE